MDRRSFVASLFLAPPLAGAAEPRRRFKIGVTDWNLRQTGRVGAVALAASLGFDGVEVSLGRQPGGGKLPLADTALQDRYLSASREQRCALAGSCLDILHVNYLKNDPLGAKWVADGVEITRRLKAKVMLLPFFGKGALTTSAEMEHVADVLKDLAPAAQRAGIILGLENTISAENNARILDRAGSPAVRVYYDVGNSTRAGFNPVQEIRWLGKQRICQIHLKDNPHYLGEGSIDFPGVIRAIEEIGFAGFANLETESPSRSVPADMRRNLEYIRKLAG